MSNDIEREAFERNFPVPKGVVWNDNCRDYLYEDIRNLDACSRYSGKWQAWQAARTQPCRFHDDDTEACEVYSGDVPCEASAGVVPEAWKTTAKGAAEFADDEQMVRDYPGVAAETIKGLANLLLTVAPTAPVQGGGVPVAAVNKASTGEYEFYPGSALADMANGIHKLYTHNGEQDGPDYPDGCDHEGFPGGCERMGRNHGEQGNVTQALYEALEYALPYLRACIPSPRNGLNADNSVDINCVDRALSALAKARGEQGGEWRVASSITGNLPEIGVPVIGHNPAWIDLDFNPRGIRECFRTGDGTEWLNSYWWDEQDCYETGDGSPTLWQPYPNPPTEREGGHE